MRFQQSFGLGMLVLLLGLGVSRRPPIRPPPLVTCRPSRRILDAHLSGFSGALRQRAPLALLITLDEWGFSGELRPW